MAKSLKSGVPIVGVIFLALALLKFVQGEGWVVWAILGVLFGGLGLFTRSRSTGDRA